MTLGELGRLTIGDLDELIDGDDENDERRLELERGPRRRRPVTVRP